ncbi:MAG: hypothetical protein HY939_07650 [Gammaproteobacteria bacterium]|nr:hypothetical protein [Gammaproteobacteria bacterium]
MTNLSPGDEGAINEGRIAVMKEFERRITKQESMNPRLKEVLQSQNVQWLIGVGILSINNIIKAEKKHGDKISHFASEDLRNEARTDLLLKKSREMAATPTRKPQPLPSENTPFTREILAKPKLPPLESHPSVTSQSLHQQKTTRTETKENLSPSTETLANLAARIPNEGSKKEAIAIRAPTPSQKSG